MTAKKKNNCISSHVGCIFLNQSTFQAPFLPKYPPNLPKYYPKRTKKHDLQKKENVCTSLWFWVPFL